MPRKLRFWWVSLRLFVSVLILLPADAASLVAHQRKATSPVYLADTFATEALATRLAGFRRAAWKIVREWNAVTSVGIGGLAVFLHLQQKSFVFPLLKEFALALGSLMTLSITAYKLLPSFISPINRQWATYTLILLINLITFSIAEGKTYFLTPLLISATALGMTTLLALPFASSFFRDRLRPLREDLFLHNNLQLVIDLLTTFLALVYVSILYRFMEGQFANILSQDAAQRENGFIQQTYMVIQAIGGFLYFTFLEWIRKDAPNPSLIPTERPSELELIERDIARLAALTNYPNTYPQRSYASNVIAGYGMAILLFVGMLYVLPTSDLSFAEELLDRLTNAAMAIAIVGAGAFGIFTLWPNIARDALELQLKKRIDALALDNPETKRLDAAFQQALIVHDQHSAPWILGEGLLDKGIDSYEMDPRTVADLELDRQFGLDREDISFLYKTRLRHLITHPYLNVEYSQRRQILLSTLRTQSTLRDRLAKLLSSATPSDHFRILSHHLHNADFFDMWMNCRIAIYHLLFVSTLLSLLSYFVPNLWLFIIVVALLINPFILGTLKQEKPREARRQWDGLIASLYDAMDVFAESTDSLSQGFRSLAIKHLSNLGLDATRKPRRRPSLHQLYRWSHQNMNDLRALAGLFSELEVFLHLASQPEATGGHWTFPVLLKDPKAYIRIDDGHPHHLPPSKSIGNPFALPGPRGETVEIVTGNNMSGKSTRLVMAAVMVIQASLGGAVRAAAMSVTPDLVIGTSLYIHQNLWNDWSRYKDSVERMTALLRMMQKYPKALILFDEPLEGTNYRARMIGLRICVILIQKLGALTAMTTHEPEIANLPGVLQLQFPGTDHKIQPGIFLGSNGEALLAEALGAEFPEARTSLLEAHALRQAA